MAQKKASGIGSKSRRLAEIRRPDGGIDKVPAAKDAATYLFMAEPDGSWPSRFFSKFLYDAVWIVDGVTIELEEMRPGKGMGSLSTVQAIETRSYVQVYPNGHGQVRRLVLVSEIASTDALSDLTDEDLEEDPNA